VSPWCRDTPAGVHIAILVTPRASRSEVAGVADGRLRIRLAAPPVDGAANAELLRFLAKELGLPRSAVELAGGARGRRKTALVRGVPGEAVRRLAPGGAAE
jgi:uncharacterized protein (TIGR00251 family)